MKWSIHQLKKLQHKGLTLDETIDLSDLKESNQDILNVSPVHVTGSVHYGASNITFRLRIRGTLTLACCRTLVDVPFPIDIETTEMFLTSSEVHEEDETADDIHILKTDVLDLIPVIKENILVEIPLQVFAEGDTSGGAPSMGQGWQVVEEIEREEKLDPRLADLAKFFDKKN